MNFLKTVEVSERTSERANERTSERPPQPTDPSKLTPKPNTAIKNLIIYLINN